MVVEVSCNSCRSTATWASNLLLHPKEQLSYFAGVCFALSVEECRDMEQYFVEECNRNLEVK